MKENVLEKVMKYWLRLWEINETNPLDDAMGQQKKVGGPNEELEWKMEDTVRGRTKKMTTKIRGVSTK
jgi:hypothetical protein